jgi:hypothetical protein
VIRREVQVRRHGFLQVYHGHPLVRRLLTADEAGIAHVIELAVYLKRLARVPGIDGVLPGLRDESSYRSTLLQLAYCYRFMKAGADVALEPDSAAGLGDIRIGAAGRNYQVECLARKDPADPYKEFTAYSADKMFDRSKSRGKLVRIRVRFLRAPNTQERLELERVASDLIDRASTGTIEAESSAAIIAVDGLDGTPERDFLPSGDPDPSGPYADRDGLFARSVADLKTVMTAAHTLRPRERGTRIFWWRAPAGGGKSDRGLHLLLDTMEKKLAQTRNPSRSAGRILTLIRMWSRAPAVMQYVANVALGRETYDEGRIEAAKMILSRCIPTITSQAIQADTTAISATIEGDNLTSLVLARANAILQGIQSSAPDGRRH